MINDLFRIINNKFTEKLYNFQLYKVNMAKFKKKKVNKKSEDQKKPYKKLESQILKKSEGASNPGGESKEDINEDDVLTLELVNELGGTEDDMKLIDDIEGKDDTEDISKETKSRPTPL